MAQLKEVSVDITCPVCKGRSFYTYKVGDKFIETVCFCQTNRLTNNPCPGKLAYCKKCKKYYPENGFGYRNDVYECKECGTVQWELTDIIKENKKKEAVQMEQICRLIRNM